jgi:AcrR family transcriptional regulator
MSKVPKIKAASIPEHRAAQRAAILQAARVLILEGGLAPLTFGVLADRTGLARPSVYEYFRTKSELVVELIKEEMPAWRSSASQALAHDQSPEAAIGAFVRALLALVQSGRHELPFALAASELDDEAQAVIGQAHREVFSLLGPHIARLGVQDIEASIEFVSGVVMTAGQALRRTPMRRNLIEMAVAFTVGGLTACTQCG